MNHWILQMNPNDFYPITHSRGEEDWWGIRSTYANKVTERDTVFIWHSIDKRNQVAPKPRGIYALGTVLSVLPHPPAVQKKIDQLKQYDRVQWRDTNKRIKQEAKPDILIIYDDSYEKYPLTYDEIVSAGLGNIHIVTFPKQDICSLSESDAAKLMKLLLTHPPDPSPSLGEGD
jgi:hypothetical protein